MNNKINWERFNPEKYVADNYAYIHEEDKQILDLLIDFYKNKSFGKALEIGVGPNLYPIMVMLPYVDKVESIEFSQRNIKYLTEQIKLPSENWHLFYNYLISSDHRYVDHFWEQLNSKVFIKQGSIFNLPKSLYDLGSMNFVAESITDKKQGFQKACDEFIFSVKSGGYLVASFMENSNGYKIDGISFPAYPVHKNILENVFAGVTNDLKIHRIPLARTPLRPGYTGMLLVTARRK